MNSKNKILTVLLLTIFVMTGGGYYFYLLTNPATYKGTYWYEFFAAEPKQNFEIAPDYYDNLPKKSLKGNRVKSRRSIPEMSYDEMSVSLSDTRLAKNSFSQRQYTGSTYLNKSYSYKQEEQDNRIHSTLSGGLAYNNSTTKSVNTSAGTNNSSGIAISSPLAVPFSNSAGTGNSTQDGTILFDPGAATTEEIEKHTIPVGEGWWVMLILGLGYLGYKRLYK